MFYKMNKRLIGERIKEERTRRNLKQEDFAKIIQVSKATISNYEKGKVLPPMELLLNLSKWFDVSLDWLCGVSENKNAGKLKTYADVFALLVEMSKNMEFVVAEAHDDSRETNGVAVFFDEILSTALQEYQEMKDLQAKDTINEHLLNLWIDDKVKQLHKLLPCYEKEFEEDYKELESLMWLDSDDDEFSFLRGGSNGDNS